MPRFKVGDRVQLTGEIARFYPSVIGIVKDRGKDQSSVLVQYDVRLADETVAKFFDFQLQTPPVVRGRIVYDEPILKKSTAHAVASEGREIRLIGADVEVHLEICGAFRKSITEHVSVGKVAMTDALVTVLVHEQPIATKRTDGRGDVEFHGAPSGDVTIETLVPGKRIVVSLNV